MKAIVVLVIAAVVAVMFAPMLLSGLFGPSPAVTAALLSAGKSSSSTTSTSCPVPMATESSSTAVQMSGLTDEQVGRAHTVWQVAHEVGFGDEGAIVGIMTLAQESTYGADPKTHRPDSNMDSGPFQQRTLPGWYASGKTVEENTAIVADTAYAARTFFTGYKVTAADHAAAAANGTKPAGPVGYVTPGLAQVKGWKDMRPTAAAQAVQRSAFPEHYAKHEPTARQLVQRFNAEGAPTTAVMTESPVLCDPPDATGEVASCPDTGLAAEKGLTPDATRVLRCVHAKFGEHITGYGGVRADSMPFHPSGRAVDFMVLGAPGDEIAEWLRGNAESMGVDHVIWKQRIWSVARSSEGWRSMEDRGSATANHLDHVHVTVFGNKAGADAPKVPVDVEGRSSDATVAPVDEYGLSARHGQAGSAWSSGFHTGLDFTPIPAGANPPIKAVQAGTVSQVTTHAAYGNLVVIDHGNGVESWSAHLSSTAVRVGQRVAAGAVIGNMGATGNVRGANPEHLHLEIRVGGKPVDPDAWLAGNGVRLKGSRV